MGIYITSGTRIGNVAVRWRLINQWYALPYASRRLLRRVITLRGLRYCQEQLWKFRVKRGSTLAMVESFRVRSSTVSRQAGQHAGMLDCRGCLAGILFCVGAMMDKALE